MKAIKIALTILLIGVTLQGCSSTKQAKIPTEIISMVTSSGRIRIEMKGKEWQKIESIGSADISIKDKAALEQSMVVATLRAKANLIEFLDNDIKSFKKSKTTLESLVTDDNADKATKIATATMEEIVSRASHILKGAQVTDRVVSSDQDYVSVTIAITRKNVEAVEAILKSFQ